MEKTFKLKIIMENDAFVENENQELSRILMRLTTRLEEGEISGNLRDINGNTVGRFSKEMETPIDFEEVAQEIFDLMGSDDFGNHTGPEFLLQQLLKKNFKK